MYNQKGAIPILILVAIIGVISALVVYNLAPSKNNLLSGLYPKPASQAASSDWGPETGISAFGGVLYDNIAATGTTVHLFDSTGGVRSIKSTDEGSSWGSIKNTGGTGNLYLDNPVDADGSNVYVLATQVVRNVTDWCCGRDTGNLTIQISRDDGQTWGTQKPLTSAGGAYRESIAHSGTNLYVVWMDYRSGSTWDVYYRRSTDQGNTWGPETKLISGIEPVGAERVPQ